MEIKVRDILGEELTVEDAILLREIIRNNLNVGVLLDFEGFERVPSTFINLLVGELLNSFGRDFIFKQISVKNLSNYTDYSRVVLGTSFQ
ncbi:STAS-like domain-containing protein [Clostridium sp. Sa3CUN1]|uniref:STAS-like domain-containing protein n=1 Tax=Clostridium gallinarum TaxID=2762246 RepID=A0ABR8Q591_9CLOT|nr:STAS-like domain-containing protein [Clostridium gallinarum]MBD7915582.1 STAS-like domain-containing protein [Clostridium gallinarum]